jgi:hypothetical protein
MGWTALKAGDWVENRYTGRIGVVRGVDPWDKSSPYLVTWLHTTRRMVSWCGRKELRTHRPTEDDLAELMLHELSR